MMSESKDEGCCRIQRSVFVRGVDVDGHGGIFNGNVLNLLHVNMLDITGGRGGRSLKKLLDHFAAQEDRMAVLTSEFGNYSPLSPLERCVEFEAEMLDSFFMHRRTVNERDDRRVAAMVQNFLQADLQGTELAAFGLLIFGQRRSGCKYEGRDARRVLAAHHDHHL